MGGYTKEFLERTFGTISDDVYGYIVESVNNDMQNLADYNVTPSRKNYEQILATNTEFYIKHFAN